MKKDQLSTSGCFITANQQPKNASAPPTPEFFKLDGAKKRWTTLLFAIALLLWQLPVIGQSEGFVSPFQGKFNPEPFTEEQYTYLLQVEDPSLYRWQVVGAVKINGEDARNFQNGIVQNFEETISIEWDSLGLGFDSTGVGILRVLKLNTENPGEPLDTVNEAMAKWNWPWNWGSVSLCIQEVQHMAGTPTVYNMAQLNDGNTSLCPGTSYRYSTSLGSSLSTTPSHRYEITYILEGGALYKEWWNVWHTVWHDNYAYTNDYGEIIINWYLLERRGTDRQAYCCACTYGLIPQLRIHRPISDLIL